LPAKIVPSDETRTINSKLLMKGPFASAFRLLAAGSGYLGAAFLLIGLWLLMRCMPQRFGLNR
jgi:hypothetical protein